MPSYGPPTTPQGMYTQRCGLRVISISRNMANVHREIQRLNYIPTSALKSELDQLLNEYEDACVEFHKAEALHPFYTPAS